MKRTMLSGICVALLATVVGAAEMRVSRTSLPTSVAPVLLGQSGSIPMPTPLSPTPDPNYTSSPYASTPYTVQSPVLSDPVQSMPGQPMEVYQNVRYRGERNIAPCAVPTIIQVPDPCNKNSCCKTCVNVQVCVPPCDPACIKVTRDGNRVRYDYGQYAVVVRSAANHVVVHYED